MNYWKSTHRRDTQDKTIHSHTPTYKLIDWKSLQGQTSISNTLENNTQVFHVIRPWITENQHIVEIYKTKWFTATHLLTNQSTESRWRVTQSKRHISPTEKPKGVTKPVIGIDSSSHLTWWYPLAMSSLVRSVSYTHLTLPTNREV